MFFAEQTTVATNESEVPPRFCIVVTLGSRASEHRYSGGNVCVDRVHNIWPKCP